MTLTFADWNFGLIIMMFARSPPRRIAGKQHDKRPEERQTFGSEFQVSVFSVASPLIRRSERGTHVLNPNTCILRQMSKLFLHDSLQFSRKVPQILGDDIIAFQYHAMLLFKARGDSDNICFPSPLGIFLECIQKSGNMAFDIR